MPDVYPPGEFDLAGFIVGVVERDRIIDGSKVAVGDVLLGIPSSGLHTNGFSLVNRLADRGDLDLAKDPGGLGTTLGAALLAPHRPYRKPMLALRDRVPVHGIAHITGGGLTENIPRVIPEGLEVRLDPRRWQPAPVFSWLQQAGNIAEAEMYRTFNCGIGMTLHVPPAAVARALEIATACGEQAQVIGGIAAGSRGVVIGP